MKKSAWIATAMAAVSAALVLAPIPSRGQSAEDAKKARGEAAKAKRGKSQSDAAPQQT